MADAVSAATAERWCSLLARVAPAVDAGASYRALAEAYGAPERYYHTLAHVGACLGELDGAAALAHDPDAVELALWLHDVVYDSRADDNEARSAAWAGALLGGAAPGPLVARVGELILATRHAHPPDGDDQALVCDIDLAVFGAPDDIFDAYEGAIRLEYAWVPDDEFRAGRRSVLEKFIARERIYATPSFHDRLEQPARRNLLRSLSSL